MLSLSRLRSADKCLQIRVTENYVDNPSQIKEIRKTLSRKKSKKNFNKSIFRFTFLCNVCLKNFGL